MNDSVSTLIESLKDQLIEASALEIRQIVDECRQEALTEAKAVLKERMLQGILEHAVGRSA